MSQSRKVKHGLFIGHNGLFVKHLSPGDQKLYRCWRGMKVRCHLVGNKDWDNYGGRGIVVCDRWRNDFMAFKGDMGHAPSSTHSIGRIDNDGPYSPENCRWESVAQQVSNTRNTVLIEHNGEKKCVADWARIIGITPTALHSRMKNHPREKWFLPVSPLAYRDRLKSYAAR